MNTKYLIIAGIIIAVVGVLIGYDEAIAALLLPFAGKRSKEKAENAKVEADVYKEQAKERLKQSQHDKAEAESFRHVQEQIAEDANADNTVPVNEVVEDAKQDWD